MDPLEFASVRAALRSDFGPFLPVSPDELAHLAIDQPGRPRRTRRALAALRDAFLVSFGRPRAFDPHTHPGGIVPPL